MNKIMIVFVTIMTITFVITILISMISKKAMLDTQKSSPFECGFNPMSSKRLPFSIHFFLVAVLFLIFDIEIIIIMPMIFTMKSTMMMFWLITTIMFIIILTLGLYHEWYNGMLNWTS
nr:NADH dehydrogenase subunit 3 [Gunungidia aurantiifasciata]